MLSRLLILTLLTSGVALSQELPDAPRAGTPRSFWATSILGAVSVVADTETTMVGQKFGCVEGWSPTLYGVHPTRTRMYGVAGSMMAAEILVGRKFVRSRRRWLQAAGYALVGQDMAGHYAAAFHNLSYLDSKECH